MRVLPRQMNRRGAWGPALALALALVLLLAQFLGQTHGISHARTSAYGPSQAVDPGQVQVQIKDVNRAGQGVLDHLFSHLFSGHEGDSADCRAYDQLSHIDTMPGVAALVLPLVIQPFVFSISSGLATARWHALFQARGPPSLR